MKKLIFIFLIVMILLNITIVNAQDINISNNILKVQINEYYGYFTIYTDSEYPIYPYGGIQVLDEYPEPLIYDHRNHDTYRIDGINYVTSDIDYEEDLNYFPLDEHFISSSNTSTSATLNWFLPLPLNISIQKTWTILGDNINNTRVKMTVKIKNNHDTNSYDVGVRSAWNLQVYDDDYVVLKNWTGDFSNTLYNYSNGFANQTEWISPKFNYWEEQERDNENLSFYGSMNFPVGSSYPDSFYYISNSITHKLPYDFDFVGIVNWGKSAIAYFWDSEALAPNGEREIITYILTYPLEVIPTQCHNSTDWVNCSDIQYGDTLTQVRADCRAPQGGDVDDINFKLVNKADGNIFFQGNSTSQSGYWWYFDNVDLIVNDSGWFNITTICYDENNFIQTAFEPWFVPWGTLEPYLISPSTDKIVFQNRFFNFTAGVRCVGGECGNITAILDPEGSGTEEEPYIITNITELQDMNKSLTAYYELGNDIDASDTINWNSGKGFNPIGNLTDNFGGYFDGNEYKITNLFINRTDNYTGLFGYINITSEIENIRLINITNIGYERIGGFAGGNKGNITNVYVTGIVNASVSRAGGITYINYGGIITKSYFIGNVSSGDVSGGLVGFNYNLGKINNSYSVGNVLGKNWTGGLVGSNSNTATIINSYSAALVNGLNTIGGLVGDDADGTCTNNFYDTQTSKQSDDNCATGKTTAQMMQEATFTNWDFINIWNIHENVTYPFLQVHNKGLISESAEATPFYTIDSNPQNLSDLSCLGNMKKDDSCNQTWQVNATGSLDSIWEFFTIYYSNYEDVETKNSAKVDLTIKKYYDLYLNIQTLQDIYTAGDLVNITDPPEKETSPEKQNKKQPKQKISFWDKIISFLNKPLIKFVLAEEGNSETPENLITDLSNEYKTENYNDLYVSALKTEHCSYKPDSTKDGYKVCKPIIA